MAAWLRFFYKRTKAGESKYHEVTDYVKRLNPDELIRFAATLDNQRLEFEVNLLEPFDEDNVRIYPVCGDDIVVTDENITIVYQNLAGWIYNVVPDDTNYESGCLATWKCKLKHRDFSNEFVTIDQSSIISDTALFNLILNNNCKGFLGGTMPSGKVIPKFTQGYNSRNFPSYKFAGKPLEHIARATNTLGLHFKFRHYVEPHPINNIRVIQSINIFDNAGENTITPDWQVGINNQTLTEGPMPNPKFISRILTPNEPPHILTETEFKPETDALPVVNYLRLNGFIVDNGGKPDYETFVQDDQRSTFILKKPAMDILDCARRVDCKIQSIITPNLVFVIDKTSSEEIAYDKARLNTTALNTRLRMWIKSGDIYYRRKYTIIGQTVTLDPESETEIAIPDLLITDQCWHVNGYDVLKEGLNSYPGSEQGYVKKSVKFGEKSSITFTDYDKPNNTDVVIIGFLPLREFRLPKAFLESKEAYDMSVVTEQIPFPITEAQFETISNAYEKQTVPRQTFSLVSQRENVCEVGWSFPINLIHEVKISGNFIVDSVAGVVVCNDGLYNGKPTVIQHITLTSYRDNLADFLAQFNNEYALAEALLEENTVKILNIDISVTIQVLTDFLIETEFEIGAPFLQSPTEITATSITIPWTPAFPDSSTSYRVKVTQNGAVVYDQDVGLVFSHTIPGLSPLLEYVITVQSYNSVVNVYSVDSNTWTGTTAENADFDYSLYSTGVYYNFDEGAGTSTADLIGASNPGSFITPNWAAGFQGHYGQRINAVGQGVYTTDSGSETNHSSKLTLMTIFKLHSLPSYHPLWQKYNFGSGSDYTVDLTSSGAQSFFYSNVAGGSGYLAMGFEFNETWVAGNVYGLAIVIDLDADRVEVIMGQVDKSLTYNMTVSSPYNNTTMPAMHDTAAAISFGENQFHSSFNPSPINLDCTVYREMVLPGVAMANAAIKTEFAKFGL